MQLKLVLLRKSDRNPTKRTYNSLLYLVHALCEDLRLCSARAHFIHVCKWAVKNTLTWTMMHCYQEKCMWNLTYIVNLKLKTK